MLCQATPSVPEGFEVTTMEGLTLGHRSMSQAFEPLQSRVTGAFHLVIAVRCAGSG